MNWKRFFSLLLVSLFLLTFAACGKEKSPVVEDSGSAEHENKEDDKGFFEGIVEGIFGDDKVKLPSLFGKGDDELISQFLGEYEKALNAPAYFKEYNYSVLFNSNSISNSIGYFMVNGKDFSVDWVDYAKAENSATFIYKDGILYTTKAGGTSQKTAEKEAVRGELEALGTVYREIPRSEFASQTLTRNEDGSFLLDVTLTEAAVQQISADVMKASSEIPGTRTFQSATMTLAFAKNGSLLRSRLIANVDITSEDGTVQVYSAEEYLKYTSFDASKIVISAPEQPSNPEDSGTVSDTSLPAGSSASDDSEKTTDTTDGN